MPTLRGSALNYLRDGHLRVLEAITHGDDLRPVVVRARVHGHTGTYEVVLTDDVWSCPCGRLVCPHVAATCLVTGWPSRATKPARERSAA